MFLKRFSPEDIKKLWLKTPLILPFIKKNRKNILILLLAYLVSLGTIRLNLYIFRTLLAPAYVLEAIPYKDDVEVPLDERISITFSSKMNKKSVEKAFSISPFIEGSVSWEGNTLVFTPNEIFKRGDRFIFSVSGKARNSFLVPLGKDYTYNFETLSNPNIAMAAPMGFMSEETSNILVMFNKSVIKPETDILTVEPEVLGERKWIGSTAYVIRPENLEIGQEYKVTLNSDLASVDGGYMEKGYSFSFINYGPAVISIKSKGPSESYYSDSTSDRDPRGPITLFFNQPVDTQDVFEKFSLRKASATEEEVPVRMVVSSRTKSDDSYYYYSDWESIWQQKIEFYPSTVLEAGSGYYAELSAGFKSQAGGAPAESGISLTFNTADQPGFISSGIADGETEVSEDRHLEFTFRSPMDPVELARNTVITPSLGDKSEYYMSTYGSNKEIRVNRFLDRSQKFTVFIPSYTKDLYGRPLGEDIRFSFTTSAYKPSLSIHPSGEYFAGFSSSLEKRIITRIMNLKSLEYNIYSLTTEDYLDLARISRSDWQNINLSATKELGYRQIGTYKKNLDVKENILSDILFNFDEDAGIDLKPGYYFLDIAGFDSYGVNRVHDNIVLTVGNTSVTTKESYDKLLVWAADMSDTKVKSDYKVNIYSSGSRSYGDKYFPSIVNKEIQPYKKSPLVLIAEGQTNSDGVFIHNLKGTLPDNYYVEVRRGVDDVGGSFNTWNNGIYSYQFDDVSNSYINRPQKYKAFVYTDRTMYRPGQKVFFHAFVRSNDLHTYSLPPKDEKFKVDVKVSELYGGSSLYSEHFEWSEDSSYDGSFEIPSDLGLGRYEVIVSVNGVYYHDTDFEVQEYVRPEFEVNAKVPESTVIKGSNVMVGAMANYFYGAPVVNSALDYRLYKRNYIFNPQTFNRYKFYSTALYFGDDYVYRGFEENTELEGSVRTDSKGEYALSLNTGGSPGVSEIYTFSADVLGQSGRKFTGSDEYVVHMADFYIGAKADSYIGEVDKDSVFEIVTIKPDTLPKGNRDVSISVYKRDYFRVKKQDETGRSYYETSYEDELIETDSLKTDDKGKAKYEFEPSEGGLYIVEFVSYDNLGNKSVSDVTHYVSSGDPGYWIRENHDRIDLVTDKDEYDIGNKARLMAISTMEQSIGLITVEAESILDYKVVKLDQSSNSFELDIKNTYVPNVYVSGMFVGPGSDVYHPPEFKMGIKKISVSASDYKLDVNVKSDKETYKPKDKGEIMVRVSDKEGKAVPNAKVSLALVDDALMTISPIKRNNAFEHFYASRTFGVETSQSLTTSLDRVNANTEIGSKGGSGSKGGAGGEYVDLTRKDFSETALWTIDLVTDVNGYAKTSFELPDSITRWNIFALAQSSDGGKFGQNVAKFGSALDIFSLPAVPRFLRENDEFQLSTVIHNNTSVSVEATAKAEVDNIELKGSSSISRTINPNSSQRIYFEAKAGKEGKAKISFSTYTGDRLVDIVETELPVLPFGLEEVQSVSNVLNYEAQEQFTLEEGTNKNSGGLETRIFGTVVGLIEDSLVFLRNYDYYCTEQVTSVLLPHIYKYKYNEVNSITDEQADIKRMLNVGLSRLSNLQRSDGGWGFWKESVSSDVHNTARALEVLISLQQMGYKIEPGVLSMGRSYLENNLNLAKENLNASPESYAYPVYVLEMLDSRQNGRIQILYDRRSAMSDYGKSFLIMAMHKNTGDWSFQEKQLLGELVEKADLASARAFWSSPRNSYWYLGNDSTVTAAVLRAFNQVDPRNPVATLALRYLTQAGKEFDHKITYHEKLKAVAVLENLVNQKVKLRATGISLSLNGENIASGELDAKSVSSRFYNLSPINIFKIGNNDVMLKSDKGGQSYYSMVLTTLLPFEQVSSASNDIALEREFYDASGKKITDAKFKVGESYVVKLIVAAPNVRRNLVIEDYLAAGFESVNDTFENESSSLSNSYGYDDYYYEAEPDENRNLYVSKVEMRDSKTILFSDYMDKGFYEYTYVVKAVVPGTYKLRPAQIYEMYSPDVRGNTDGGLVEISY